MVAGSATRPVILFDGLCNLCTGSVQFVIRRDPRARFQFAALQSDAGRALAQAHGVDPQALDSVILIDNGKAYRQSSASLRIARHLRSPWPLLYALLIIPAPLRNIVYDFVGKRRYRWFGKRDQCWIPQGNLKDRFLD